MEARLVFYLIWGVGVFVVYSIVLARRRQVHAVHHDKRSRRDLAEAFGLWLVALAASMAVATVLFEPLRGTISGLLTSIALGAFFGVGVIMATEEGKPR